MASIRNSSGIQMLALSVLEIRKQGHSADMLAASSGARHLAQRRRSWSLYLVRNSASAPALCNSLARRYPATMNSRRATNGRAPRRVRLLFALFSAVLSPCLAAASSALADQPGLDLPTSWAALANDSAMRPSE